MKKFHKSGSLINDQPNRTPVWVKNNPKLEIHIAVQFVIIDSKYTWIRQLS